MSDAQVELLQRMPVFGAVSGPALAFILARSQERRVTREGWFFREGDTADGFYVLASGRVAVLREHRGEPIRLAELGPGDCFGEMAIVECRNRNASVRALEDCTALALPVSALHALYEEDLEQFVLVQMNLARELSRRLSEADEHLFAANVVARELGGSYRWDLP